MHIGVDTAMVIAFLVLIILCRYRRVGHMMQIIWLRVVAPAIVGKAVGLQNRQVCI